MKAKRRGLALVKRCWPLTLVKRSLEEACAARKLIQRYLAQVDRFSVSESGLAGLGCSVGHV